MVNVSKQPLEERFRRKIIKQLSKMVARSNHDNANLFLGALLTQAEQITLAKRLAAVILLHDGRSPYEIARTLRLSQTTVGEMKEHYEDDLYKGVITVLGRSKKEKEEFMEFIGMLSRGGMPPMGNDRWKFLQ